HTHTHTHQDSGYIISEKVSLSFLLTGCAHCLLQASEAPGLINITDALVLLPPTTTQWSLCCVSVCICVCVCACVCVCVCGLFAQWNLCQAPLIYLIWGMFGWCVCV